MQRHATQASISKVEALLLQQAQRPVLRGARQKQGLPGVARKLCRRWRDVWVRQKHALHIKLVPPAITLQHKYLAHASHSKGGMLLIVVALTVIFSTRPARHARAAECVPWESKSPSL